MDTLVTAGIDVGSSAIKAVITEDPASGSPKMLAGRTVRIRRRDPMAVVDDVFAEVVEEAGVSRDDLVYVATTGEGEMVSFRTGHFYGMTTHARGGHWLDPEARAVIDIGALHARAVLMDERAKVLGYRMTSQCASGSGQFLENICRYLGVTLEEIGTLSLEADDPEKCSSVCAVLAETDVINMVSRGITIPNILRGIHDSMAGRYVRLLTAAGARGRVLVTGGLSADLGLLQSMRDIISAKDIALEITRHDESILAGALGAALWGAFRARKLAQTGWTGPIGEATPEVAT
jgi:benzoyl-CoA reductase subunit D